MRHFKLRCSNRHNLRDLPNTEFSQSRTPTWPSTIAITTKISTSSPSSETPIFQTKTRQIHTTEISRTRKPNRETSQTSSRNRSRRETSWERRKSGEKPKRATLSIHLNKHNWISTTSQMKLNSLSLNLKICKMGSPLRLFTQTTKPSMWTTRTHRIRLSILTIIKTLSTSKRHSTMRGLIQVSLSRTSRISRREEGCWTTGSTCNKRNLAT